jgi:hypothetical protein
MWPMAVESCSSEHPPRIRARRSWPSVANRHVNSLPSVETLTRVQEWQNDRVTLEIVKGQ